ncbi:MAG TPA: N-acetylmuramoyl-L-alanine amidase [Candidatus Binatia bacterium]|nr:N-acetylmuramoyl-L-alanine amidase [Candidatus Binatia bacterium]
MRVLFACLVFLVACCVTVQAAGEPLAGTLFVVDPGHGVRYPDGSPLNPGAVAPNGVQEQQITLRIGELLAARLRADGAHVVLTRSAAHPYRTATDARQDNHARAALANRLGATAFIAIHCDASTDPSKRGTSVFWLKSNSVAFANNLRRALAPLDLGESEFRPRHLAVTDEARVPAVLVELGFITNMPQQRLLLDRSFETREVSSLESAIVATFGGHG